LASQKKLQMAVSNTSLVKHESQKTSIHPAELCYKCLLPDSDSWFYAFVFFFSFLILSFCYSIHKNIKQKSEIKSLTKQMKEIRKK
jgi:hypothetical protein